MKGILSRREMLRLVAAVPPSLALAPSLLAAGPGTKTRLGVDMNSYGVRWSSATNPEVRFKDVLHFLEHCHGLGAAGIQARIDSWENDFAARVRGKIESWEMYLEGQVGLPRDESGVARFESVVRAAKEAGASVLRTVSLGGRRYEDLDSANAFRNFTERAWKSLVLAEAIVRKHRLRLAIENHKDWRVPELLDILKRLSSEHVGVCVDTGNSLALLENPTEVVEAYAPWALTTHLKDMAVREYEEGFLLSEVPLGEGFLDMGKIIAILRRAKPEIHFNLEMITRDPLKIPCLTKKYWATFEALPARHLAEALAMVRGHTSKNPLPRVTGLTPEQKLQLEEEHVRRSFAYARDRLGL